nr:hypothetical protein [Tanacetum cinerariifolium]
MLILDEFLTDNIRAMKEYKETPSTHKTSTATAIVGDVVHKKRKRKQVDGEMSSPKPSLRIDVNQMKPSTSLIPPPSDDRERDEIAEATLLSLTMFQALNVDSLKVDLVVTQNTCSKKEDSNSENASSKSVKEYSLDSATRDVHEIKYKMSKAKERCMAYFQSLHSHLQVLSKEDLKGTRIEHGFKWAFMSLFGQDADTFTCMMLLNVYQLHKKLVKDKFQEDGSMAAFCGTESEFQDDSRRSRNDTDADDADIRPRYDEEPKG